MGLFHDILEQFLGRRLHLNDPPAKGNHIANLIRSTCRFDNRTAAFAELPGGRSHVKNPLREPKPRHNQDSTNFSWTISESKTPLRRSSPRPLRAKSVPVRNAG